MNIDTIIRTVQVKLGKTADGKAGPETWAAIYDKIVGKVPADEHVPSIEWPVDDRSQKVIDTLHREVKPYARALVLKAKERGITIKLLSGLRTYAEQDALFAKGNVTKARGGYSNHNFGIAFDIGIFQGSTYLSESPLYKVIGALGVELGLEWGGNWKTFVDEPHFQLRPNWASGMSERDMLAELRRRKDGGRDYFA
jgi:peptidoglycan L-alanyl-D-glutamate endopeptidase CwlK